MLLSVDIEPFSSLFLTFSDFPSFVICSYRPFNEYIRHVLPVVGVGLFVHAI